MEKHVVTDNVAVADRLMNAPYATTGATVVTAAAVDPERGLTDVQVRERRERFGLNQLAEAPPVPAWRTFLRQFRELVVLLLFAAALIAGVLGEWADSLAILAIVGLNGIIGFLQEFRAEQALAALCHLATPTARVVRDGQLQTIPARRGSR